MSRTFSGAAVSAVLSVLESVPVVLPEEAGALDPPQAARKREQVITAARTIESFFFIFHFSFFCFLCKAAGSP